MDSTARALRPTVPAALATLAALAGACSPTAGREPSAWRDQVHRRSEVPGLGWELVPGIDLEVEGLRVRTSSIGARDEAPTPGEDVFRVAALGGCFTFGWGVEGEAAWPRRLERELAGSILVMGRAVDFLDLAVCGYGATEQLAALEHGALDLQPWLVVLEHSFADPSAPHLAALRELAGRGPAPTLAALHDPQGEAWARLGAAWARTRELCAPRLVPVVLLIVPHLDGRPWEAYPYRALHAQVAAEGRRRGLAVLDLLERFEAEPPGALLSAGQPPSPSPRAQELAADAFKRFVYSSGVLTQVLEAH